MDLYTKKYHHDPDNHDDVITHLEPDILECEVKWASGSITTNKASRGDGITVELFQILKDNATKVLHSIYQQIWKTQQWQQDWKKVSFYSNPKERQCQKMFKLLHNCTHLTCCKVMLKILQARLQQYVNCEHSYIQVGFRKGRGTGDQIASIHWIIIKARDFQKNIYFGFFDYAKCFDCVDHNELWKILKEIWEYQTT